MTTIGWYGIGSIPLIYDTFIENLSGKRLTDTLTIHELFLMICEVSLPEVISILTDRSAENLPQDSRARFMLLLHRITVQVFLIWMKITYDARIVINDSFIDKGEAIHDPGSSQCQFLEILAGLTPE